MEVDDDKLVRTPATSSPGPAIRAIAVAAWVLPAGVIVAGGLMLGVADTGVFVGRYWLGMLTLGGLVLLSFVLGLTALCFHQSRQGTTGLALSGGALVMSIVAFVVASAPIRAELAEAQEQANRKLRLQEYEVERREAAARSAGADVKRRRRRLPMEQTPKALTPKPASIRVITPATILAKGDPVSTQGATLQLLDVLWKDIAPGACLSQDGNVLYLLRKNGRLQKINVPAGFVVEREAVIPGGSHLALAQPGLVVACRGPGELVVLDPQSLQAREKLGLAGCRSIAASPHSPLVYAVWDYGFTLRIVDLTTKHLVADLDATQVTAALQQENAASVGRDPNTFGTIPVNFSNMHLSPDGRRLLVGNFAFQMRDGKLQWEASRIDNKTVRAAWATDLDLDPSQAWRDARGGDPATGEQYVIQPKNITLKKPDGNREIRVAPPIDYFQEVCPGEQLAAIRPTGRGLLVSSSKNLVWIERTPANVAPDQSGK